jgi:transposase
METQTAKTLYVGIDVHKRQWSVSIFTANTHHRTFSQPPQPEALHAYLHKFFKGYQVICAYEACKFGFWIYRKLTAYGYDCLVINPADIPTTNKESSEKTDPVDSRKIARALQANLLKGIHVPAESTLGERQLFRYRKRLWADLVRIKNRIKDKLLFFGITIPPAYDNPYWSKAFLAWLAKVQFASPHARQVMDFLLMQYEQTYRHLLKVSIEVRKIHKLPKYKEDAKRLRAIPGIGPLTSVQLLVEIEDINRFRNFNHFNGYLGLKPMVHSSGDKDQKSYMTYRSHHGLRSSLVECAWTAIQRDPVMLQTYEELLQRHTKKRAIVKIARKLAARVYRVLKEKEEYEIGLVK